MKKLRTVFCILAIALVLSLSVCVTYSGGEIALADDGSNVEVVVEEATFLSRLQSFIEKYRTEILAGAGTIVSTIGIPLVGIIVNKKLRKASSQTIENTSSIQTNTQSNAQMVETFNKMIALYNDIDNKLSATENNTQKQKDFALATLKIMQTVYANSKNVPQAIKDLVNISYVGAIKGDLGALQQATEALKGEVKNEIGGE